MKKIYTFALMALLAVLTMTTFTSFDKDTQIAWDLDGVWSGTIVGDYYVDRYHGAIREDVYDTEMEFVQNGDFSRGGTGYQIDRNRRTGNYVESHFNWTVDNRRIRIYYLEDRFEIIIRDYEIYTVGSTYHSRGYFDDAYDGSYVASFDLVKIARMRSIKEDGVSRKVSIEEFK